MESNVLMATGMKPVRGGRGVWRGVHWGRGARISSIQLRGTRCLRITFKAVADVSDCLDECRPFWVGLDLLP